MAEIIKAVKKKTKLKLGVSGGSGTGKTLSSLFIAYGMMKEKYPNLPEDEIWGKICCADTENESCSLYAGDNRSKIKIGEFNVINIKPPFTTFECIDAIETAVSSGMEVLIIDSFSTFWNSTGGILEKQAKVAKSSNNSYTAWAEITPLYNKMVDAILQSDIHIITTLRSKVEYSIEKGDNGKSTVKKLGMASISREGFDYEMTTFFELNRDHSCVASKDRSGIFDTDSFIITPDTGKKIMRWLEQGIEVLPSKKEEPKVSVEDLREEISGRLASLKDRAILKTILDGEKIPLNCKAIEDVEILKKYLHIIKDVGNN